MTDHDDNLVPGEPEGPRVDRYAVNDDAVPAPAPADRYLDPPRADPADPADPTQDQHPGGIESDDGVEEPFPTLPQRLDAWRARQMAAFADDPGRILELTISVVAVALATAVVLAVAHPSQILSDTTATGGDMGSHVWGPRYLADHLLPHFRLTGWTPDWYDGFPAYQFYMVVPSLIVVALFVGLPWFLAIPAVLASVVLGLSGWLRRRAYPYRYVLVAVGALLGVLSVGLPYNQSFKIVTVLGLLGLPAAAFTMAKLADLPFPIPPIASVSALIFIFNREPVYNNTGNIIGGNFTSTMAGEFAFSISLTLAVLYLGVAVRGLKTGKHRALAAVLFAGAGLCHLIPAFFVLGCTAALFVVHPNRARFKWLLTMVPVAGLLTAFWVLPFALRADYVNDMGWEKIPVPNSEQTGYAYYLWPKGLFWLLIFAIIGVLVSILRRHAIGLVLGLAWAGVAAAFVVLPQARLWNARLLPFQYLSIALLAAIGIGELVHLAATAASGDPLRPARAVTGAAAVLSVAGILLYVVLPLNGVLDKTINRQALPAVNGQEAKTKSSLGPFDAYDLKPAAGWSDYNYKGLEKKPAQPEGCDAAGSTVTCTSGGYGEYRALIRTMAGLGESPKHGCGRSFWEYDGTRLGTYGTPMALMMLPYWTDGCIGSQEGLYFESSTTVPYHFYMQAELSTAGSNPQRDLVYPSFDINAGVRHLQLLGVKYYLASTPQAVTAADGQSDLTPVATSGPWHVYEVADAATVAPLDYQPVVVDGMGESQDDWLPTAGAWFLDQSDLDVPITDGGPASWKRVDGQTVAKDLRRLTIWARGQLGDRGAIDPVPDLPRTKLPANKVSNIDMGRDTISFDVAKTGVPVLVKASYFPNWEVSGADGPYRVSPNLMVVIPRSNHVALHYGRTPVDLLGAGLTLLGLVLVVLLARKPPIAVPPEQQGRVAAWLDEIIAIPPMEKAPRARRGRRRPAPADDAWATPADDERWPPLAEETEAGPEPGVEAVSADAHLDHSTDAAERRPDPADWPDVEPATDWSASDDAATIDRAEAADHGEPADRAESPEHGEAAGPAEPAHAEPAEQPDATEGEH